MATKKPRATPPHPAETQGRPLLTSDLDAEGKALADKRWLDMGQMKTRLPQEIAKHQAGVEKQEAILSDPSLDLTDKQRKAHETRKKSHEKMRNNFTDIHDRGLVEDVDVTVESAAQRRVHFFDQAGSRAQTEGDIRSGRGPSDLAAGARWYPGHVGDIHGIAQIEKAEPTQEDRDRYYASSGSMSPLNSPQMEKTSLRAIAAAHRENSTVTPTTKRGAEAAGAAIGKSVNIRDMTPERIGKISSAPMHAHLDTTADLGGIGSGGTNVPRGVGIFRGDVAPEDYAPRGPAGAPKLYGYIESMRRAGRANANEVSEFYRRVHEGTPGSAPYFQQPTVFGPQWEKDPYGKADSTEGILDPKGPTAEDSWMQTISLGQPHEMEALETGKGSARVGKTLGSDTHGLSNIPAGGVFPSSSPRTDYPVTPEAVLHALNQEATHRAAEIVTDRARADGRNMGAGLPSQAIQPVSWDEYRIQADKDDDYTEAIVERGRQAEFDKHGTTIHKGQKDMFSGGVGSQPLKVRPSAKPPKQR